MVCIVAVNSPAFVLMSYLKAAFLAMTLNQQDCVSKNTHWGHSEVQDIYIYSSYVPSKYVFQNLYTEEMKVVNVFRL